MSGVRIYDLAKELKLTNNDLLEMLKGLGEPGKTASSTITDDTADAVRKMAAGGGVPAPATNGTSATPAQRNGSAAASKPAEAAAPAAKPTATAEKPAEKPAAAAEAEAPAPVASATPVDIPNVVSLKDFADLINIPAPTIQKKLMGLGVLASLAQKLSPEVVTRLA